MSYEFMLMRLSPAPHPGRIADSVTEDAHQPIADAAPLHDAVRASALFAPGAVRFDDDRRFTWNTPDGGQVDVTLVGGIVSLRMHAHWIHARRLFELAHGVWPDLMLLDLQQGEVHDAASFGAAIERNDRAMAAYDARLATDRAGGD